MCGQKEKEKLASEVNHPIMVRWSFVNLSRYLLDKSVQSVHGGIDICILSIVKNTIGDTHSKL